jgi:type II secretory pathway pseudopilin PulG
MKTDKNTGYTILETMIFLIVSSVIFVSVALLITGQVAKYQAKDAVNQLESVVRNTLNDVGNGYFPIIGQDFNCTKGPSTNPPIVTEVVSANENRGTNPECIIIGKSIEFRTSEIKVKTWVANADIDEVPSTLGDITLVGALEQTIPYKWGITKNPTTSQEYFIMYAKYSADVDNTEDKLISGSQNIQITSLSGNKIDEIVTQANFNHKICFDNGHLKSSLVFADNSLNVESNYLDESCPS